MVSNTDLDSKVIDIAVHQRKRASRAGKSRYGFDDYSDDPINNIEIESIAVGNISESCHKGEIYEDQARKLLQFSGNSPVNVERYQKSVLRCNTCGLEFMNHFIDCQNYRLYIGEFCQMLMEWTYSDLQNEKQMLIF